MSFTSPKMDQYFDAIILHFSFSSDLTNQMFYNLMPPSPYTIIVSKAKMSHIFTQLLLLSIW